MSFDLKKALQHQSQTKPAEQEFSEHGSLEMENQHYHYEQEEAGSAGRILHQWSAPEFEVYEKSGKWYLIAASFIAIMVLYALFNNDPIMAITFILIGIVGYIYLQKDPRIITFSITSKGVVADKEIYLYENINSFWIFYDPIHTKTISLHTKASMLPYIHIPLNEEDPVHLRSILIEEIPEIKQEPSLIDAIERVLHI